jgi:hypothetical protein
MRKYTNFDDDAEFDTGIQWTLLPLAETEAQQRSREEALADHQPRALAVSPSRGG